MSAVIAAIIRAVGLPVLSVAALLVFYEGIPGASRIPFLTSVPVLGDLTAGRVHSYAASQVAQATAGLVARTELAALTAQLDQERRYRRIADDAAREARIRAYAAEKAKSEALADLEKRIAEDTAQDGAQWTQGDLEWLAR